MSQISDALHLLLALIALWCLAVCWCEYRLDRLRQDLFSVRDDLFLQAALGEISFTNEAYARLRTLMNGMIRYAHRIRIPQIIAAYFVVKEIEPNAFFDAWTKEVHSLPDDQRILLQGAYEKMQKIVTRHLRTSLFGALLTLIQLPLYLCAMIVRSINSKIGNTKKGKDGVTIRSIRSLEEEAYMLKKNDIPEPKRKLAHMHS